MLSESPTFEARRGPRTAVIGAGAIGSTLGGLLAKTGRDVTLIARGDHLAALRQSGLVLEGPDGADNVPVNATDDPAAVGPCDVAVFAVKAHQLADAAEMARPLLAPDTIVVCAINGLPWWYFRGHGGPQEGLRLNSVDPDHRIMAALGGQPNVGCVVYCAAERPAPGHARYGGRARFILGAPETGARPAVDRAVEALAVPGVEAPVIDDIRQAVWIKLWGNAVLNPVTALTGATVGEAASSAEFAPVMQALFEEVADVFTALGIAAEQTAQARIAGAARLTGHKSSMLQDIEAGRPIELDEMVAVIVELAERLGVPAPQFTTVLELLRLKVARQ